MSKEGHSHFLSLVVDDDKLQQRKTYTRWLLQNAPNPLPDDCHVIQSLDDCPKGFTHQELRTLIEDLVSARHIDRVRIGSARHLVRHSRPVIDRDDDKVIFQLEIALDLEAEKQLLYSIIVVLETIVISLFIRQALLYNDFLPMLF